MIDLKELPKYSQRQDSLSDQLSDLIRVADRFGLYDAADAIEQIHKNIDGIKYGCIVDLEPEDEPMECVLDDPEYSFRDCIFAKKGMRKEQCEYWKIIK